MQEFTVTEEDSDIRLDRWFKRNQPGVPHGVLQKALRKGQIRLDGKKAEARTRVEAGQVISLRHIDLAEAKAEAKEKRAQLNAHESKEAQAWVIYKDAEVIAINKPAGLAVQGGSKQRDHVDARLPALQFDAKDPPRLVHRLDKDTSGVLLLARSAKVAGGLAEAFAARNTQKVYWALVHGVPEMREGEIESRLEKSGGHYEKMQSSADGKKAITQYRVVEQLGTRLAWMELQPVTGRTHQLRVHMAELGHPIVGDAKYGSDEEVVAGLQLPYQLHLHARRLLLERNGKKALNIAAPLPAHMKKSWKWLGLEEKDL
tara:strand:- start:11 stop:958 length:948 start_codon:yes stop_codon:yes gene_type:complete